MTMRTKQQPFWSTGSLSGDAQAIWDAIIKPEWTERDAYGGRVQYELKGGRYYHHEASPEMKLFGSPDKVILGEVLESDPRRKWCRHGTRSSCRK